MIWAYGVTRPDPDPDADLVQHLDAGSFVLAARKHDGEGDGDEDDGPSSSSSAGGASSMTSAGSLTAAPQPTPTQTLTSPLSNSLSSISSTNSSSSSLSSEPPSSSSSPLPTQLPDTASPTRAHHIDTLIAAHASLSFLGFAVFLPLAALITRWSRTFTAYWFRIHWLTIAVFGAPCMLVGWVLGPLLVSRQGHRHVVNEHQVRVHNTFIIIASLLTFEMVDWRSCAFRAGSRSDIAGHSNTFVTAERREFESAPST